MFGFLGKLFGTDKALTSIVESVSSGLDSLVYTDEEKAGDAAKDRQEARAMIIQWMSSTQGQNLARRLIALSITGVWLMMYILGVLMSMASVWAQTYATKLTETAGIAKASANDMSGAVMLILAFYFAAPHMGTIATAAMERFGGRTVPTDRVG